jgi:hypothetical protein
LSGISGPTSIGTTTAQQFATTGTGLIAGVNYINFTGMGVIEIDQGYKSGAQISSTATWANSTFSSLGLTPGTYEWTWGSGPNADDLIVQIGPSAVPAPTSLALAGVGGGILLAGAASRRRRQAVRLAC